MNYSQNVKRLQLFIDAVDFPVSDMRYISNLFKLHANGGENFEGKRPLSTCKRKYRKM